jgi:hypothetical protein
VFCACASVFCFVFDMIGSLHSMEPTVEPTIEESSYNRKSRIVDELSCTISMLKGVL